MKKVEIENIKKKADNDAFEISTKVKRKYVIYQLFRNNLNSL